MVPRNMQASYSTTYFGLDSPVLRRGPSKFARPQAPCLTVPTLPEAVAGRTDTAVATRRSPWRRYAVEDIGRPLAGPATYLPSRKLPCGVCRSIPRTKRERERESAPSFNWGEHNSLPNITLCMRVL